METIQTKERQIIEKQKEEIESDVFSFLREGRSCAMLYGMFAIAGLFLAECLASTDRGFQREGSAHSLSMKFPS